MATTFTKSYEVIGSTGKRFIITDNYTLQGKEPVQVDPASKATDLNQWVRRKGVEIVP